MDDLKLVCDGHFDDAKKGNICRLKDIIEPVDTRNENGIYGKTDVRGINNKKEFAPTKADIEGKDLSKFLVIDNDVFAYNSRTDGRDMLVLGLNRSNKSIIVTWNYNAFKIKQEMKNIINSEYLYAYFKRSEFDRLVRFCSWGSSQELLSWDNLCDISVPCPTMDIQRSIADINNVLIKRKAINERMKTQIKSICPILIKGSLEEGQSL